MGYDGHRDDGHDHHHHHDHGHDHHHHHDHDHDHGAHGPEGSEFLDLEISQMLLGMAQNIARDVALDLIREAARERLSERLGDRLAEVGRLAADEMADDVEANLEIEGSIGARRERASTLRQRLEEALRSPGGQGGGTPTRRAGSSKKKKKGRSKRPVRG